MCEPFEFTHQRALGTRHWIVRWPNTEKKVWSVEHEGPDAEHLAPSADNPRKRALIKGIWR